MTEPDCVFCRIVAGDEPARVIHRDERTVSFMDTNPIVPGHCLVVPRSHSRDWLDAPPEDLAAVAAAAQQVGRAAMGGMGADGVNFINATGEAALQTVFHLHLHVLPRSAGDDLKLPVSGRGAPDSEVAVNYDRILAALD